MKLSQRQKDFARYYVDDPNATKAAKLAGYSDHTAYVSGPRQLHKVQVQQEIERLTETKLARLDRNGDDVMRELWADVDSGGRARTAALPILAKAYKLTTEGLTLNIDNRQQWAHLSDAQLAVAAGITPEALSEAQEAPIEIEPEQE